MIHPKSLNRRRNFRRSVITAIAALSILVVAACSGSSTNQKSGGSGNEVTIWAATGVGPVGAGPAPAGWKAVTNEFETANPDIKIKWKNYSPAQNPSSYQTLLTAIAGGKGPDVAAVDRFLTYQFSVKGAIEPLEPHLDTDSPVYKATKLIPGASFEQTVDGQLFGITFPWQAVGFWSLCYNKKLFAQANLNPPTTWDEVVSAAKKLTKMKGNRYTQLGYEPFGVNDATNWFYSQSSPTPLVSDGGKTANLTNPDAQAAVTQFVRLMDAQGGYAKVSKFANPTNTLPSQDPFYTGRAAMVGCGDWYLQTIAENFPKLPVGVVALPPPNGGKPSGWAGGWSFQLVKGTKNAEPAAKFLEYLMTKDASKVFEDAYAAYNAKHKLPNVIIGAITFMYPDLANSYMSDLKKDSPDLYESVQHFLQVPETYATVNYRPQTLAAGELFTDFNNAAIDAALHNASPQEALEKQNSLLQKSITANNG